LIYRISAQINMQQNQQVDYIQALRGLAAIAVVICHSRFNFHGTGLEDASETFMRPGAMGVDLFFLVSGFIMVFTTEGMAGSLSDCVFFLIKRFSRIWPVYAIVALSALVIARPLLPVKLNWPNILESLAFSPVDPRKPPYFDLPYALGWTLNFEAYFYLVFGLSMLAKRFRWAVFFGWMSVSLVAIPLIHTGSVSLDPTHDYVMGVGYLDQMTNPIIWDFVAGVLTGLLYTSKYKFPRRSLAQLGVVGSCVLAAWWASPGHANFHGIAGWGGPLAMMFAFMALAFKTRPPKIHRSLLWLGEISFSLYLVHLVAFNAMNSVAARYSFLPRSSPFFFIAEFALAIIFAAVANRLLENGISKAMRRVLLRLAHRLSPVRIDVYPGTGNPSVAATGNDL
jgi:exopolysaccharide production protein ExoZ